MYTPGVTLVNRKCRILLCLSDDYNKSFSRFILLIRKTAACPKNKKGTRQQSYPLHVPYPVGATLVVARPSKTDRGQSLVSYWLAGNDPHPVKMPDANQPNKQPPIYTECIRVLSCWINPHATSYALREFCRSRCCNTRVDHS